MKSLFMGIFSFTGAVYLVLWLIWWELHRIANALEITVGKRPVGRT